MSVSPDEKWTRRLTVALTVGTAGTAWLGATAWVLHQEHRMGEQQPTAPCPVLVLGCRPGPALDARVTAAVALYHAGKADRLIISGWNECAQGAETARRQGVPDEVIQMESAARNTWQNLSLSARFCPRGHLWIASDRWHLPRAMWFARRMGMEAYPCPVDRAPRRRVAVAREGMSILYSVVRRGYDAVTG